MTTVQLGGTGLQVTRLCIGGAPLGSAPKAFGYEVDLDRALATLRRAFEGPFNFMDTSNNYGGGNSERRIGMAIAERGGLPEGFVLASKVDRDSVTEAFDGLRVRRSLKRVCHTWGSTTSSSCTSTTLSSSPSKRP